jgi:hypothetical protein
LLLDLAVTIGYSVLRFHDYCSLKK